MVHFCSNFLLFFLPRDVDVVPSHAAAAAFFYFWCQECSGGFHSCALFHRQCTGACTSRMTRPGCSLVPVGRRLFCHFTPDRTRVASSGCQLWFRPCFGPSLVAWAEGDICFSSLHCVFVRDV
ncbi:unnamed protein product, partial [Ectocarpus sp. 8 AP-2014]